VDGPAARKRLEKERPSLVAARDQAIVEIRREKLQKETAEKPRKVARVYRYSGAPLFSVFQVVRQASVMEDERMNRPMISASTERRSLRLTPRALDTYKLKSSEHCRTKYICLPGSFSTRICGRLSPKFRYQFDKGPRTVACKRREPRLAGGLCCEIERFCIRAM
jgi:hypothetical protein